MPLCKFYGVQLNVSEYTINAIPDDLKKEFQFRLLDKVRVKRKEEPVTMYEVFHEGHPFNNNVEVPRPDTMSVLTSIFFSRVLQRSLCFQRTSSAIP